MLSTTVTVAEQVLLLPLTSLTVRVTLLAPRWAQVKAVWLRIRAPRLQLSEEPLLTWALARLALPAASRLRVTGWQIALGAVLSTTVIVAVQVLVLLDASDTVRVTVLVPTWAQVKAVWLRVVLATAQLSVLPLLTMVGVRLAVPTALRVRVAF